MGYYSEIALCMNKAAHEKFMLMLNDSVVKQMVVSMTNCLGDHYKKTKDDTYDILIYFEEKKWYSRYKEIQFFEDFLEVVDPAKGEHYCFFDIGEDGATRIQGEYPDNLFGLKLIDATTRSAIFTISALTEPELQFDTDGAEEFKLPEEENNE